MTIASRRILRHRPLVAGLLGSVALLGFAGTARAQAADPNAPPPVQVATDDDRIPEVTVVARKRQENVQNVPIPVTTITNQELIRQNLVNVVNFQTKFPAFSVYLTNPKQLNLGVRGIGNNGFNTDGIDGSVGVFVDGVYTGRQGMISSDFNDLADIELLRGPQGTLFGKNTTAGALIINTQKPSFVPELLAETTFGSYAYQEFKLNGSAPINDKLAIRIAGYYSNHDGYYPNLYGGVAQNARQAQGVRAQLLYEPTSDLSIRLIGSYGSQNFPTATPVTLSIYNPAALQARMAAAGYTLATSDAATRALNIDGTQNALTHAASGTGQIDWHLGAVGDLTSITNYQKWDCFTNNDNDYTQLNAIPDYGSCNTEHQFSQEVRLATPKGKPIEAVMGFFLSRQTLDVDSRIRFGTQYNIWAANPSATAFPTLNGQTWAQGAYASRVNGFGIASHATFKTDTDALFANVTWHVLPRVSIDGGLRQTWEFRTYRYAGVVTSNPGALTQAQINALSAAGANAQLGAAYDHVTDPSLSGEIGANYRPTDTLMLYAKYARGYKSKGFNLLPYNSSNPDGGIATAISAGARQDIDGETADNIEIGFKSEWFDRRFLLNVTAFHTLVRNYQANEALGVGNTATKFLANVGALLSQGVEVEAEATPFAGLHLKGFVAYDDATYKRFHNSVCPSETQFTALYCDLTGRTVAWAPKWTWDVTAEYTHQVSETVSLYGLVEENYRSSQNTTITLDPLANIDGYALTNLRIGMLLPDSHLDLQFWIQNLFDKPYYVNQLGLTKSTGIVQGYPGDPRTMGATLRFHF